jgi:phosphatidylinositol-3-phosphatase
MEPNSMKKVTGLHSIPRRLILLIVAIILVSGKVNAQPVLPFPDHIVVLFLENHAYSQIIGSDAAPYINTVAIDPGTALFVNSSGIEHPSQPNYLDFYSGSNQGVTDNNVPAANPFNTPNLGRQLTDSSFSFATFSEDLPYAGFNGATFEKYVRKHNPATNWVGPDTNQIPSSVILSFSDFLSMDFNSLPTVCMVMPNQDHNMHDGADPSRILTSDTWIYDNLRSYIDWTRTNNSLFILTFDEDNYGNGNQIVTLFTGMMVKGGTYSDTINHYSVLRTIEDIYGLPYAGNAANACPITNCWKSLNDVNQPGYSTGGLKIFPNPSNGRIMIQVDQADPGGVTEFEIYSLTGERLRNGYLYGREVNEFSVGNLSKGIYLLKVKLVDKYLTKKMIVY